MAVTFTDLVALVAVDLADILAVTDDPSGIPISKKATVADILEAGQAWGEIYIAMGSAAQAGITLTPVIMNAWNTADGFNGPALNTTPAKASNQITIANAGLYHINFNISASGSPNETFHWEIRLDGVSTNKFGGRKLGGGGDLGASTLTTLSAITAGQVLSVYVNSENAGGASITAMDAQLLAIRIGA